MAEKIDLNTLPKGLTKEEFTALPNFKKIRAFFTWAGVVSIVSGIFVLSSIGHISQSILHHQDVFRTVMNRIMRNESI